MKKYIFFVVLLFITNFLYADITSNSNDVENINLMIYQNNLGFVSETRNIDFPTTDDIFKMQIFDIPNSCVLDSLFFDVFSSVGSLDILEQRYIESTNKNDLLNQNIDKQVVIIDDETKKKKTATFLGNGVFSSDGKLVLNYDGPIILSEDTKNISRSFLELTCKSKLKGRNKFRFSYLINDVSWNANYTLMLNPDEKTADIYAWLNISNNTSRDFSIVNLSVVAGNINQSRFSGPNFVKSSMSQRELAFSSPDVEQNSLFEYYSYDLSKKIDLPKNQIIKLDLFNAENISVEKKLVLENYITDNSRTEKEFFDIDMEFENNKNNNLLYPFPRGNVRVYTNNTDKTVFLGETNIEYTPKNSKIKLNIGKTFDIYAERKMLDYKKLAKNESEFIFEIIVVNEKNKNEVVNLQQYVVGDWEILDANEKYENLDANRFNFEVNVLANSKKNIKYRIKIKTDEGI